MTLDDHRRFYADEIDAACQLRTRPLVDALARVERERFLNPGPWTTKGADGDVLGVARVTPDANPERVYHNIAIALDPERQLYNGQPGTIASFIDQLSLAPGDRVLHIGAGTGYYTALIARCVGAAGRVVAYEADEALAARARGNLSPAPSAECAGIDVRHGDATAVDGTFDAILVNAGATHPIDAWLDALAPGGRLVVPITFAFGPSPIAKGIVALLTRREDPARLDARAIGFVAIYKAVGVRDEALNVKIGLAMKTNPMPRLTAFRRDPHEPSPACWLHTASGCFEAASQ